MNAEPLAQPLEGAAREVLDTMHAAQSIGSSADPVAVFERTLQVALSTVGAERACLLVRRGDKLSLEGRIHAAPDTLLEVGSALEERGDVATTVARAAAEAKQTVVVSAADQDARFAADPHLAKGALPFLACTALTNSGRLVGVLQLESRTPSTFGPTRLALLELVSRQAAMSIESTITFRDLRSATVLLRDAVEQLERLVAERTADLHRTNALLRAEMEERAHEEKERERLQAHIIAVQEARLRDASTPLIPITDRIVVMPLIGAMTTERAAQVVDIALHKVSALHAKVVLIDITGMTEMGAGAADALTRCARALRLIGAEVVLTGVRSTFARQLVEEGITLDLATENTLQRGIAYALRQTSKARSL